MANPPLTDPAAYAGEHLGYEARMFTNARDTLLQALLTGQPLPSFYRNLLIEACVLHFRNLVDFFYPPKNLQEDDVTALDYMPGWNQTIPAVLNDARSRANTEAAHLTTKRKTGAPPEKRWDFDALSAALQPVIEDFIRRVDPSKVPASTFAQLRDVGRAITIVEDGPVFHSSSG